MSIKSMSNTYQLTNRKFIVKCSSNQIFQIAIQILDQIASSSNQIFKVEVVHSNNG